MMIPYTVWMGNPVCFTALPLTLPTTATPDGVAVSEYDVSGSLYTVSGVRPLQHGRTSLVIICYP